MRVDFAFDGGDDRRIDCGDRLQIGVEPRLGGFRRFLRASELRDRRVDHPILQIAEVLAGRIGVLDDGDKLRLLGEASRVARKLPDQQRGGDDEDRKQQD